MSEQPKFGLRENFISELEKRTLGRIVSVRAQGVDFSIIGKLTHYIFGEVAVLNPWVCYPTPNKNGFEIKQEETLISNPAIVSGLGYKSIDEVIKKYIKPSIEKQRQEKTKGR